ncbi:phosphoribosylglycinamide formyltransferase [Candidatus Woesearchaeota archaeon]|nr:phosphoribosylglycinamide formyltransferase [Candidatus Woesearchaeota archaeon]
MVNKIAVMASTNATDTVAIKRAMDSGQIDAEFCLFFVNKPEAGAVEKARNWGIPCEIVDYRDMNKEEYEQKLQEILNKYAPDLILAIGYNKIMSDAVCEKFRYKIINVHPSLLPAFGGGFNFDVHKAVLEHGCKVSGCTLHFVTPDLDNGPIIVQKCVDICDGETEQTLQKKIQVAEGEGFIDAIKCFFDGKIKIDGRVVRILN